MLIPLLLLLWLFQKSDDDVPGVLSLHRLSRLEASATDVAMVPPVVLLAAMAAVHRVSRARASLHGFAAFQVAHAAPNARAAQLEL